MVAYGKAKSEWYVQAAEFCKYGTGLTAEEVAGIAVDEETRPVEDTDLNTHVTIKVGSYMDLIAKAFANK